MTNLTGFVNIVKPTGMTSSDVVLKVKKALKTKKVGHLGTLDPAASGVLPVAVGKATKFFDYFLNKDKEYFAIVEFGVETDTLDSFGNITNVSSKTVTKEDVLSVLSGFVGEIEQIPPQFSAVKINGKKACDFAREGVAVEIKPRKIKVFELELIEDLGENKFSFLVHCSAGTYIRTLFSDIAKKLGTISFTPVIIRTKSGRFNSFNSITIEELQENVEVLKIEEVFSDLQKFEANDKIAKKLVNGVKVTVTETGFNVKNNEECFVCYNGSLIGFYKAENGCFKQLIHLYEEKEAGLWLSLRLQVFVMIFPKATNQPKKFQNGLFHMA